MLKAGDTYRLLRCSSSWNVN